jgi:hypothetical protein
LATGTHSMTGRKSFPVPNVAGHFLAHQPCGLFETAS